MLAASAGARAQGLVHHDLAIEVNPASHRLTVTDVVPLTRRQGGSC
jgi:hypothetical protein